MKVWSNIICTSAVLLASVSEAFAAPATRVYSSGLLVMLFLGFCALLLVVQLIPAVLTIIGMVRGLSHKGSVESVTQTK